MVRETARVRARAGVYSAVIVDAHGSAPPIPRPAIKRSTVSARILGAKPIEIVVTPKTNTLAASTRRRPIRSATTPATAMPTAMPIRPAATAGPKASLEMPHSLIISGMAKPINWPSKPSSTIAIAAMKTTIFCMPVKGPSSSVRPMSRVGAVPVFMSGSRQLLLIGQTHSQINSRGGVCVFQTNLARHDEPEAPS